jgi:hypothetical protein
LGFVLDDHVLDEEDVQPDESDVGHRDESTDNTDCKNKRMEWANVMWEHIWHATI